MKRVSVIILSIFFLGISFSCKKSTKGHKNVYASKYKETIKESRRDLGLFMFTNDVPGLSIAVSINNEIVWSEGLGYANNELGVRATPDTKYRIGGVSRMFTGALMAKIAEDGKIDLNKFVRDYYPEIPENKGKITYNQLLSHTSGLREPTYQETKNMGFQTMRKGIGTFIEDTLLFKPGEYFLETDYGYDLIGASLEKIYNDYFPTILEKQLTDSTKMNLSATVCDNPIAIIPNRSECFDRNLVSRSVRATTVDNRHHASSCGLLSSPLDMVTLINEYLNPTFFKKETVDKILTPIPLNSGIKSLYGMGICVTQDNHGRPLYFISGTTTGGSASLIVYPKYKLVIALACNQSGENEGMPAFKIAEEFLKTLAPEEFKEGQPEQDGKQQAPEQKSENK